MNINSLIYFLLSALCLIAIVCFSFDDKKPKPRYFFFGYFINEKSDGGGMGINTYDGKFITIGACRDKVQKTRGTNSKIIITSISEYSEADAIRFWSDDNK